MGPGKGRQANRATAFRTAAASTGSCPGFRLTPPGPALLLGPRLPAQVSYSHPSPLRAHHPGNSQRKAQLKYLWLKTVQRLLIGGGEKVEVIPSLLAGEVIDMQGSWVCGSSPTGRGSHRKLSRLQILMREVVLYVTDVTGDRTG